MRTEQSIKNINVNMIYFVLKMIITFISKKIFIVYLGTQVNGVNVLLVQILGYLNMAELGIGTAASYLLYKPLNEKRYDEVEKILEALKFIYNRIALAILLIGSITAFFIPVFLRQSNNQKQVVVCFILYLLSTSASYLISDKVILITADQKAYKINRINGWIDCILQVLQIFFIIRFKSYYLYVVLMVLFSMIKYVLNNKIVKREYVDKIKVRNCIVENNYKRKLFQNVKYIFFLNLAGQVVFNTDYIVISYFLDLNSVTLYSNYVLLINVIQGIVGQITIGVFSSIGDLIAEDDNKKTYEVFKEIFTMYFYVATIVIIITYNLIDDFVKIWLGKEFILDNISVLFLMINMFVYLTRWSIETFKNAKGIYKEDLPYAVMEMSLNLVFSLILVQHMGIKGVILGTVISNVCVLVWAKPKLVFKMVFNREIKEYYSLLMKNLTKVSISIFIISFIISKYVIFIDIYIQTFLIKSIVVGTLTLVIVTLFYFKDEYFKKIITRVYTYVGRKNG